MVGWLAPVRLDAVKLHANQIAATLIHVCKISDNITPRLQFRRAIACGANSFISKAHKESKVNNSRENYKDPMTRIASLT